MASRSSLLEAVVFGLSWDRYVEPLNDARMPHGKKCVSARWGWAGKKSDFFRIL